MSEIYHSDTERMRQEHGNTNIRLFAHVSTRMEDRDSQTSYTSAHIR